MKVRFRLSAWGAGAIFGIMSGVGQAAFVNDGFESGTLGQAPAGWGAYTGVIVSNYAPHAGGKALYVPVLGGVTNTVVTGNGNAVWTDFYAKPVKLTVGAPVIDTTATAQVFVNSNGFWSTLSGDGTGGNYQTNAWTNTLVSGSTYPTVTVNDVWFHVSVMHDYSAHKWSFYVNDLPIATNLGFIAAGVNESAWFQVQNLGGNVTNAAWVDDFSVTNKINVALATNTVGATNGISAAFATAYFGTVGDPRPTYTNFGADAVVSPTAVSLQFKPLPNQQYVLLGGPSPFGAMSAISTVVVDSAATSNSLSDVIALGRGSNYFYRIAAVSKADGSIQLTNSDVYVWYKQDRSTQNRWYYSGVPVVYESAGMSSLTNQAGQQLAMGLHGDTSGNAPDLLVIGNDTYYLNPSGVWALLSGTTQPGNVNLTPGLGASIKRQSGASAVDYSVLAGTWTNAVGTISLSVGWNSLAWPFDTAATAGNCGFPGATGDMFSVMRNGNPKMAKKYGTGWKTLLGTSLSSSDWPQAGEGFMYYSSGAASWTPSR